MAMHVGVEGDLHDRAPSVGEVVRRGRIGAAGSHGQETTQARSNLQPLATTLAVLVDDDRGDDDDALHDLLVVGVDAEKRKAGGHDAQDDGADDRAGDAADAAGEGSSADDRGGDGVQLVDTPMLA